MLLLIVAKLYPDSDQYIMTVPILKYRNIIRKHDKLNVWRTRKKSEPQMGFEATTIDELRVRITVTFKVSI